MGAHRKGQPLAPQLEELGAAWDGPVRTAARYRMASLDTVPPKPGMYRSDDGAELVGERWLLSPAGLGSFLAALPEPMLLGSMQLADGSTAHYGDWLADRTERVTRSISRTSAKRHLRDSVGANGGEAAVRLLRPHPA